jgi:outer membrane protein
VDITVSAVPVIRSVKMRIFKGMLVGMLFVLLSTTVWAADVVKLGFFDMQTIIDRSEMGKAGLEKFKIEREKMRQELADKLNELRELDDEFKKKEQVWSDDVKKAKAQEMMAKKAEYDQLRAEANRRLGEQERELLAPIREKVLEIISRIGKEEGYTMIWEMQMAGLAYAPTSLELTDRIIRELNEISAKENVNE